MKKQITLVILGCMIVILAGCANHRISPRIGDEALQETWMQQVNTYPANWVKNVDPWFLTGEAAVPEKNTTILEIKSPSIVASNFNSIAVSGNFQVQIVGGQDANSVFIYGPTEMVKLVTVEVFNNRLQIRQNEPEKDKIRKVIVRVGVRQLNLLENKGNSLILGRGITSHELVVTANGSGSIYLEGDMNLTRLENTGTGTITVLGAKTQSLKMTVIGSGSANVSGQVGIENLLHKGDGAVNIIGADSDHVCITAAGAGTTTIFGYINLKEVMASDTSRVYVYWVYSSKINVIARGKAIVGLAGTAANMSIELSNQSCFQGEHMRSCNIYIKTKDNAHADVAADLKIFASSENKSSIYYFGSPEILSRLNAQQSAILPLGPYLIPRCAENPCTFIPPSFCGPVKEKVTPDPLF